MSTYKILHNLRDISAEYDAFILSVFGVIHNRTTLLPGVRKCLETLAEEGKTILVMSNTPKRASTVIQRLAQMGVPPSLYQHILTSGEEAFQHLKHRADPWHATLGKYCYYLGSTDDDDLLDDLEVYPVSDIARANFILAVGLDVWHNEMAYYDKLLKNAVRYRLPMVCANPDRFIYDRGEKLLRAGYLAQKYQEYGGQVRFHGKPYEPFYKKALAKLKRFDMGRILAIGGDLETDILGATLAGLKSAYIPLVFQAASPSTPPSQTLQGNGSSQKAGFSLDSRVEINKEELDTLFTQFKLEPNYVLPALHW